MKLPENKADPLTILPCFANQVRFTQYQRPLPEKLCEQYLPESFTRTGGRNQKQRPVGFPVGLPDKAFAREAHEQRLVGGQAGVMFDH